MMDMGPRCYMQCFVEIGPPVPKKILEGFLPYGRGGHLGHVTQMPRTDFRSPNPRRLHIKLASIGQAVSVKIFEIVDGWTDG